MITIKVIIKLNHENQQDKILYELLINQKKTDLSTQHKTMLIYKMHKNGLKHKGT